MKKNLENNFKKEILNSFKKIKLKNIKNVYVTSDLSSAGRIKLVKKKKLDIIYESLKKIMGKNFSIFSPCASMNLCNTDIIFDINKTPSNKMGPLAEYLRNQKNNVRSLNPFWSICCLGKNKNILKKVSNHAYGVGSPWSKMLDLDTLQVNIGINPERAVTLIHHIETVVGVPYRYNKEFLHPIKKNNKVVIENFYLSTRFKKYKIEKKKKLNKHFFNEMKKQRKLNYFKTENGIEIWSFKMKDFYNIAVNFFIKDIYNYLEKPLKIELDI
mgnify:CR=1 FL=1